MNIEETTIVEWMKKEKETIDSFLEFFRKRQITHPDQFPIKMSLGDWDEQYLSFKPEQE